MSANGLAHTPSYGCLIKPILHLVSSSRQTTSKYKRKVTRQRSAPRDGDQASGATINYVSTEKVYLSIGSAS